MTVPAAIDASPLTDGGPRAKRRGRVALVGRRRTRPITARAVRRPRLTRALTETTPNLLVSVVAPAGYGKTTLLCDWADRDERPFAWVTLDGQDNDPACLDASVRGAVDRVVAQHRTGRLVLVLDDLQALCEPGAEDALGALLDGLPPEVTVALASRTPPPLPVARMRAQGRLVEVGPRELAMNDDEGTAMLALAGLELDGDDVAQLLVATEGWPAALALGAITLADASVADRTGAFGGADRLVTEYVRDEILAALPAPQRRLLLETAVLDTLDGPLCDYVLERDGSAAELLELCRQQGLLIALGRSDERFRHHRLIGEMLAAELQRLEPVRAAELHRRASDWYRLAGDEDRAVRHAIGAGDLRAAGDLVWRSTLPALSRGDKRTAEAWLGLFTDAELHATPTLALASAATQLASGQGHLAEHWAQAATAAGTSSAVEADARIVHAAIARDGLPGMRDDAASAYDLTPDRSPSRAMCCLLAGTAAQLAGDADGARTLEEGAHRAAVTAPDVHALCLTQLALPALVAEDWEEAGALVTRGRAQVERYRLDAYPTAALVLAASALVRAHRGRVDEAQHDLRLALELRTQLTDFAVWYEVELAIVLARAAVRLSDLTAARGLLADASRAIRRLPGAALLEAWLQESWAVVDAVIGPASAPSALTTAELRILRFLPTHLSFREIGERVHVTANTVKTQANAVYRKLDVSCRSDAVTRARQLGMLDT